MRAFLLLAALLGASIHSSWAATSVLCQTHLVQSGDSVWSIAALYGVQQDDLLSALQECVGYVPGSALAVGQKICLPGWVPACDYVIDSGDVSNCKAYQVQAGDTIASIASTFGIYTQDLQSLNADLLSGVLQVGKFIRLPPWNQASCPDPDSDAASCRVYTVQSGDFVFGIASIFRVSMADLLAVNPGLLSNTLLQAGQRIRIPPFDAVCGNGIVASPPTTGVFSCRAYKVKTGDSLASIALLFETTVASLVSANPELSDPALLTPGKIVKINPYPAECINGILIDPKSSAAAQPAGPIASPSPAASPSPSPSPVVTPSPTASPSPSPVVASPSPLSSPSPSPFPSPAAATPTTGIKVTLTLSGINSAAFAAKQAQLAAALASLLGVPSSWVSVAASAPSQRRLQASGDSTSVVVTVAAADPTSMAAKLQSAVSSGAVASLLSALGLTLSPNSLAVNTYSPSTATPSPSPNPAAPSAAVPSTTTGSSSSNVGAIVGGVVGGVGGVLLVAGLAWFIIKKRRAAAGGEGGLRSACAGAGATAQVSTGGGLSIKTQAGRLAKEDTGYSTSPRNSTVTPRTRVGNLA